MLSVRSETEIEVEIWREFDSSRELEVAEYLVELFRSGLAERLFNRLRPPLSFRVIYEWLMTRSPVAVAKHLGRVVGMAWVNDSDGYRADLGFAFLPGHSIWAKVRALRRMLSEACQVLPVRILIATVPAPNWAVGSLLVRLGFMKMADLPEMGFWHGEPCDMVLYWLPVYRESNTLSN